MAVDEHQTEVRALAHRHQVCWETFPQFSPVDGERKRTGVTVELYGTHDHPGIRPTAGCPECIPVLQALLEIADFAVRGLPEAPISIRAHSGIEYATERAGRADIVVALTFALGPSSGSQDADPTLRQVCERLSALGAAERSWTANQRSGRSDSA
jgi:hypothetical protein